MKLQFALEYRTDWGQDVRVLFTVNRRKGAPLKRIYNLETNDGLHWTGNILVQEKEAVEFQYRYQIYEGESLVRQEWNGVPRLFPWGGDRQFVLTDYWKDTPQMNHIYTSAYQHVVSDAPTGSPEITYFDITLLFRIEAPQLQKGQCLALLGNMPQLGQWEAGRALRMSRGGMHEWCLTLSAAGLEMPFEYKYVVLDEATGELLEWEGGSNRRTPELSSSGISEGPIPSGTVHVVWDKPLRMDFRHWKAAGVCIPVFSLRSQHSQGVGDFGDLKIMVDWANRTGMSVIQLLPIYDTTQRGEWTDCYPYSAISVYALHPMYLDLSQMPRLKDESWMKGYESRCKKLNALPAMDYEQVFKLKQEYLHALYAQEGDKVLADKDFKTFYTANQQWVLPYAVFCVRRDDENEPDFTRWHGLSRYNRKDVDALAEERHTDVFYYIFVQYLLEKQLTQTANYARSHGVILKGDLPIGISRNSVEAWMEPEYFNMDMSAGAPPDEFSADGQNWGFPTYNWERMAQDDFKWWRQRLGKMSQYFDAFRVDHVLGFFRIWEIPLGEKSLKGHFNPQLPLSIEEIERLGLPWRRAQLGDEPLFLPTEQNGETVGYSPLINGNKTTSYKALTPVEQDAFNRIWEEFYFKRHDIFWAHVAMKRLPAIVESSGMLCCAEDLGMVPGCVGPVLKSFGILTLEIQTMPKGFGREFAQLDENPYHSVATFSTHDMLPMRMWWMWSAQRARRFYNYALQKDGPIPVPEGWDETKSTAPDMPEWLCEEVVARHLFCPSMLCILSLQDWLAMSEELRNKDASDERINDPGNDHHYWRWRMHISLEQLMAAQKYNDQVKTLVERSGR